MTKKKNNNIEIQQDNNNNGDINMEELESKSRVEMVKVAKSINLPSPTVGKKNELFERIKTFMSSKKQMEKDQLQQDKQHTFESNCFDLQIKEIEQTERLFWKVFRNKVMFKTIVSNLSSNNPLNGRLLGITTFKYQDITNVSWMLHHNHLELLKLKILNGESLSYANRKKTLAFVVAPVLEELFEKLNFKSNIEQGIQFYTTFFKHYWSTISLLVSSYSSTYTNHYIVLKVLLDNGYIIPTIDYTLSNVMNTNSLKAVKLVTDTIIKQQKEEQAFPLDFENSKKLLKNKFDIKIGIINYLLESNILSQQILDELVDKVELNLFEPKLLDINIDKYHSNKVSIFNRYKLKDLINSCILILSFKKHQISNDNTTPTRTLQIININEITSLTISTINEIKSTFTKQQLNQLLNPLILNLKQQGQDQLSNIKKLILLYFTYESGQTKYHCSKIYLILFGGNEIKEKINECFNKNYFRQTLKYGNSKEWVRCNENKYIDCESFIKCIRDHKSKSMEISRAPLLFKYCNGTLSIDSKIQFIKEVYNSMAESSKDLFLLLLLLVIEIDDLKLLKQVLYEIPAISNKSFENLSVTYQFVITQFIRSLEMLDYCWIHFQPLFKRLNDRDGLYFYHFMDTSLLKRYDQLKCELNEPNTKVPSIVISNKLFTNHYQSQETIKEKTSILYLKMLKSVIQNPCKSIKYTFSNDLFSRFEFPSPKVKLSEQKYNELLMDFQYIIENTFNVFYNPNESTKNIDNNVISMKLMEWEYQYRQHDSNANRCSQPDFSNPKMYYITGRFDKLVLEPENLCPWNEGTLLSNLDFLDNYFKKSTFSNIKQDSIPPYGYYLVLEHAAIYNRLDIFQYIFKNHPLLLKKKVGKNDGLLSVKNFSAVVNRCLSAKTYHILDFFESIGIKLPNTNDHNYNIHKSNNNKNKK